MGLRRVICSVILLAAIADFAYGQGYGGRRGRPVNPGHPSGCPPLCSLPCPYGFQTDNRGCSICRCNQGPIIEPFPPTTIWPCSPGTVRDTPTVICNPFSGNSQCRSGATCHGGPADEPGYCCRPKQVPQNVHCPVDNSRCWNNQKIDFCTTGSCGNGLKCCKRACGRRCVPAQGELYRPGRGGRRSMLA